MEKSKIKKIAKDELLGDQKNANEVHLRFSHLLAIEGHTELQAFTTPEIQTVYFGDICL